MGALPLGHELQNVEASNGATKPEAQGWQKVEEGELENEPGEQAEQEDRPEVKV